MMEIGGIDLVLEGDIRGDAPMFVRGIIERHWPAALVWDANDEDTTKPGVSIAETALWVWDCELFVSPGQQLKKNPKFPAHEPPYMHLFIKSKQVTIVVDPPTKNLGERIIRALRGRDVIARHAQLLPNGKLVPTNEELVEQAEYHLGSYLDEVVCATLWAWPSMELLPKNRAPLVAAVVENVKKNYDVFANTDHDREAERLLSMLPEQLVEALRRRLR